MAGGEDLFFLTVKGDQTKLKIKFSSYTGDRRRYIRIPPFLYRKSAGYRTLLCKRLFKLAHTSVR